MADTASVHVNQIRRYEAGTAQPTLEALHVSLDDLVFAEGERGPSDDLRLRFEAVSNMPDAEKAVIKALLDGMILKYQASRIMGADNNSRLPSA